MARSWCCICDKKASKKIGDKYYCSSCKPPAVKPVVDMDHPDWEPEPKEEEKGFWEKLADILEKSGRSNYHSGYGPF